MWLFPCPTLVYHLHNFTPWCIWLFNDPILRGLVLRLSHASSPGLRLCLLLYYLDITVSETQGRAYAIMVDSNLLRGFENIRYCMYYCTKLKSLASLNMGTWLLQSCVYVFDWTIWSILHSAPQESHVSLRPLVLVNFWASRWVRWAWVTAGCGTSTCTRLMARIRYELLVQHTYKAICYQHASSVRLRQDMLD